ncbi:hypothetical protein ACFFF5_17720 [Lederbergia wuyishanensis]|uniref:Lipoprotein n=1 Tax=Lederbergia wuyishanensis TaxID=1347903 RepID=A0ABU0DAU9_9BACI|nr:hypothetical protein [Lederbergia wuyishanensis]MCJ8009648.1 hypothetical protein [Lederbergia wuyishanensis]MDQ0345478.1 hypothetical protein [Lederbergia wuyishanensis]
MKKYFVIACLFLLTGCTPFINNNVIIDWVDFLHFNGEKYLGSQLEIADSKFIGGKIGKIKKKLDDNVKNPNYKSKNGDAAFLPVGTNLYEVINEPNLIAVRDKNSINGYKIYSKTDYKSDFYSINKDEVVKIQIFDEVSYDQFILRKAINNKKDIGKFIDILQSGNPDSSVVFDYADPKMSSYVVLVYTSESVAKKIPLFFDGEKYFWHHRDSEVLPKEVEEILNVRDD